MKIEIFRLKLISPLFFIPDCFTDPEAPFNYTLESGEKLFCFELDKIHAKKFEPDKKHFPGFLIFSGKAVEGKPQGTTLELPQGDYIFTQVQDILSKEDIIELAVELQNEGLWQRLELGSQYYLRYLFEDKRGVTQLFRPYTFADIAL